MCFSAWVHKNKIQEYLGLGSRRIMRQCVGDSRGGPLCRIDLLSFPALRVSATRLLVVRKVRVATLVDP